MNLSTILQFATLLSVMAAIIGLIFSIRAHQRQLNATFLLEYTKRVDDIMRSLPPSVWGAHVFPDEKLPESSAESRLAVLRCLTLVSQLHYFTRKGYFPKELWRKHEESYSRVLRNPLFVREWKIVAPMFTTDPEFCQYVESAQNKSA